MNTKNKILLEKGIKIPRIVNDGRIQLKYLWGEMQLGDSFFIPNCTNKERSAYQKTAQEYFYWYNRKPSSLRGDFRLLSRSVEGGIRFWKVENKKTRVLIREGKLKYID